jgi:hypothetical protein
MKILGKFTEGQYWRWVCSFEQISNAQLKVRLAHLDLKVADKDIEILNLKRSKLKAAIAADKSIDKAKRIYAEYRAELEKELDLSLEGVIIDPVTYEIKLMEEITNGTGKVS